MTSKNQFQNMKIIRYLIENEVVTTAEISREIGLSEKTIRIRLKDIEQLLINEKAGKICRKPRIGTWLEANDEEMVRLMRQLSSSHCFSKNLYVDNPKTRQHQIKREVLKTYKQNKIHPNKLVQMFYISQTVLNQDLMNIESALKKYDLKIMTERNSGLYLEGDELSYRLALKDYMFENDAQSIEENLLDFTGFIDTHLIKKSMLQTEEDWGIKLDEFSFNQVMVTISITIIRIRHSENLHFPKEELSKIEKYSEYSFAQAILNKITKKTGIEFTLNGVINVAIGILCSRFIVEESALQKYSIASEYDDKLCDMTQKMIRIVSDVLDEDLTDDEILFTGLVQHLRPLIFRMKYEMSPSNHLIDFVKEEYKLVYRATWSISILFEEFYGLNISEHELSYIAIYFEAALQRQKKSLEIILVTKRNMSYTQLLKDKISRSINNDRKIRTINYHEFDLSHYPHVDIILTTDPLYTNDKRVVLASDMLIQESIEKVNQKIEVIRSRKQNKDSRFNPVCHQLFDPELIIVGSNAQSKEELIHYLSQSLFKKGYVNEDYEMTVINHEYLAVTEIGNGVAIPHGSQYEVNESKVAIGILREPVLWNEERVDVVFLLAIKMTTQNEIEKTKLFYKDYIEIIKTDEKIDILRAMPSEVELYHYLIG